MSARPCSRWEPNAFLTTSPTRQELLRADCGRCPERGWCRQQAADSPVAVHGVWGGLVLPAEAHRLPAPHTAGAARIRPGYEDNRRTEKRYIWRDGAVDPALR